jgi:hypothetical protein
MTDNASTLQPKDASQLEEAPYGEVAGSFFGLIEGFMRGHVLRTGLELGVFEALADEPRATGELAEELGLEPEYAYRLLRALASTDFVTERPERSFSLTPLGRYLKPGHPDSIGNGIRFWFNPKLEAAWSHLPTIIAEGLPDGFEREFGATMWGYFEDDDELGSQFHHLMSALRDRRTAAVTEMLADYDFEASSHVCDVGGGHGHMLCHLLDAHPHLKGTVLDLHSVIEQKDRRWAQKLGVEDRCTYQTGDMLEGVPRADAYFLQGILNSVPEADAIEVLSNIRESASRGARVFIIEPMIPESTEPDPTKLIDIQLMITTGGRSRTPAEYKPILQRSGLEYVRSHSPEETQFSMVEASRP